MYSQNQEEKAILEYFDGKHGTFLDIGANDGVTFSNTRALAERGWSGVLVEPSPQAFVRLKHLYKGYKGFYCYPYAIGDHNGKGMFQESGPLCSSADIGLVSTFHQSEKARFHRIVEYSPVEVKVFKWKTFLNRLTIKEFNFISIDCEGHDLCILKQMDISKTSCICLEWNGSIELRAEFDKLLHGFRIIYTSGENLLYSR